MHAVGLSRPSGRLYPHAITLSDGAEGVTVVAGEVTQYQNKRLSGHFVDVFDIDGLNLSKTLNYAGTAYRCTVANGVLAFNPPLPVDSIININTSAKSL